MQPINSLLSAVIITYNEEHNIEGCLQSLIGIVDEIVVVDSLSIDRTKEICKKYNVVFIEQPFLGYVEQKNFATAKASHAYVLSVDADERLSEPLRQSILKEKTEGFRYVAYRVNRYNNYCGQWIKHGDYYPDRKLRLWKNGIGTWRGNNPHDKFDVNRPCEIHRLKGDLLHYSFRTYTEHISQMNRFSSLAAQTLFEKGKKPGYYKPWINAFWAFINGYFFRLGFLDGFNGFVIARTNGFYTFFKYAKLNELHRQNKV